jgi:hypothetical protein
MLLEAFKNLASSITDGVAETTKVVIVEGKEMTDRTLAEVRLKKDQPLIITEKQLNIDTIQLSLSDGDDHRYYFFRDIDQLLPVQGLEDLLLEIMDAGHTVVAECRSGDELKTLKQEVPNLFSVDGWREVPVNRLALEEITPFRVALEDRLTKESNDYEIVDRSIGSYFMSLAEMENYYANFDDNSLEKHILWALRGEKLIHADSQGNPKYLAEYAGLRQKRIPDKILLLSDSLEFTVALDRLIEMDFVHVENNIDNSTKIYRTEEIYLERIVVSPAYKKSLLNNLDDDKLALTYAIETKDDLISTYSRLGDAAGIFTELTYSQVFNRAITRSSNSHLKKTMFKELVESELQLERYTINSMLYNANILGLDRDYLFSLLFDLEGEHYGPDAATLSFYVGGHDNFGAARKAFSYLISKYQVVPDEYVLRSLLRLANNFDQAWHAYEEISSKMSEPILNPYIYYGLVKLAKRFSEAYLVFQDYQLKGVDRVETRQNYQEELTATQILSENIIFYESVIRKPGGQPDEVRLVMDQLKSISEPGMIQPFTFAALIEKLGSEDFEASKSLLTEAKEWLGGRLTAPVYTRLIKHSCNYDVAFYYLEDLLQSSSKVTQPNVFNSVLANAKTTNEANKVFSFFDQNDIEEDIMTIAFRVKFATTDEQAFDLLEEVYVNQTDKFSLLLVNQYLSRLSGGKDFKYRGEKAEEVFKIAQELDLYLAVAVKKVQRSYALLIRNFRNTARRLDVMRYVQQYGAEIDLQSYWYCIIWSKNWEEIAQTFSMMKESEITPSLEIVRDAARKLIKNHEYRFDAFLQFVSNLQGNFPEIDSMAYMNLFDVFVVLKEREQSGKNDLLKLYDLLINGGQDISARGYETLMWIELDGQRTKDIVKIQENYIRKYNKLVEVPSSYFENFFRRCSSFEQLIAFYDQMDKIKVERRVFTYIVMFDVLFSSVKRKRIHESKLVKQLFNIIKRAHEYDKEYPSELFDSLLKSNLSNQKRVELYDLIRKHNIKVSTQARQEVFWLKTPPSIVTEDTTKTNFRRDQLLDAVENREVLIDYIDNCLVFSDAIILLEQAAVKRHKRPPIDTYEAVLWLATNNEEVNKVIQLLRHREKETFKLPTTFICRLIRYANSFEEAEDIYFDYIELRPELNTVLAYNLMRRPDASFEKKSRVFRRAHEEKMTVNPVLTAQLSRSLITAQDGLQFIALIRNYQITLHPDAVVKLLMALPPVEAWRLLDAEITEEAVKKARQIGKHKLHPLYDRLKGLKRGTLTLNKLIGNNKMSSANRLYFFLMAVTADLDWNKETLLAVYQM